MENLELWKEICKTMISKPTFSITLWRKSHLLSPSGWVLSSISSRSFFTSLSPDREASILSSLERTIENLSSMGCNEEPGEEFTTFDIIWPWTNVVLEVSECNIWQRSLCNWDEDWTERPCRYVLRAYEREAVRSKSRLGRIDIQFFFYPLFLPRSK